MEKNGTISNSGGLVQWRHAAVKPPGEAKPDGEIVDLVFRRVRDVIKDSADPKDEIIKKAFWTYTTAEDVLREINGRALHDVPGANLKAGDLVKRVADLQPDGSTSSGAWIYAGVFGGGVPGPGPEEPPCSPRCGLRAERWPTAGNVRAR